MSTRILAASVMAVAAIAVSPTAVAQMEGDGWYVGAHGALVHLQNGRGSQSDPSVPSFSQFSVEHDDDIGFGIAGGYAFPTFRFELEVQQYTNPITEPGATSIGSNEVKAQLVHLNAWYPVAKFGSVEPFVGGGLGYAKHEFDSGDDSGISMQLGVGADWSITEDFTLTALFRFFDTESIAFQNGTNETGTSYQGQALSIGIRYDLFSPPPPPEPEPEPIAVVAPLPACSDGQDNDDDGLVDHPADLGCSDSSDNDETDLTTCADGQDNDGDGLTDYPDDPGCESADDRDETDLSQCGDGQDNDGDGVTDFPDDPGCKSIDDNDETDPCKTPGPGEKVDLSGCGTGDKVTLRGVNFELNKATLTADSSAVLDNVVEQLLSNDHIRLEVGGHTDSTGADSYNQNLSERRANSVRDYLVANGVEADRLTAIGYGEAEPVESNDTREGRAENRRVELKIL